MHSYINFHSDPLVFSTEFDSWPEFFGFFYVQEADDDGSDDDNSDEDVDDTMVWYL